MTNTSEEGDKFFFFFKPQYVFRKLNTVSYKNELFRFFFSLQTVQIMKGRWKCDHMTKDVMLGGGTMMLGNHN